MESKQLEAIIARMVRKNLEIAKDRRMPRYLRTYAISEANIYLSFIPEENMRYNPLRETVYDWLGRLYDGRSRKPNKKL